MRLVMVPELPTDPGAAVGLQDRLRGLVETENPGRAEFRTVAGVDSAYDDAGNVVAAVVVLNVATLELVDTATARGRVSFPYVPGLLAFRELPTTIAALEKLGTVPDLLVCDGQGIAHPRRFGLACHLGVLTGVPSIGVAKTVWGEYVEPGRERGAFGDITIDGEVVGRAVRTQSGVKPVYVSVGHRIDLETACAQVLALTPRYRQPETTRQADHLCRMLLREG
ncbi:endonuclease V [Nocardia sp. CDC159]|uniref:Endonuclease V n=1 Tax=Nocardia pulmonis TaxID=2951408 RepID=A0A9X2IXJ7_9NOCA|nr:MULTISPECIES: endonuclease V [Nocardia]MCM6773935.1 endonuclease V [Nocardia pulmonis]MCM6786822.1 endonuclease V [Nocardia sp. CDC159]